MSMSANPDLRSNIFFFNDTATTEIYTLSLQRRSSDLIFRWSQNSRASAAAESRNGPNGACADRSEEHTSELQSHSDLLCRLLLEKKKKTDLRRKRILKDHKSLSSIRIPAHTDNVVPHINR